MAKNSMSFGFTLTNFKEFAGMLRELPASVESRVMGDAIGIAAKPIMQMAKAKAPKRTGALSRSIITVVRRYPKAGKVMALVGPDKEYYSGGKRLKKGASRQGADRPAKYAHLVEFGHQTKNGFVAAKPFIRPAVAAGKPAAINALADAVGVGMEREIGRVASKLKRLRKS